VDEKIYLLCLWTFIFCYRQSCWCCLIITIWKLQRHVTLTHMSCIYYQKYLAYYIATLSGDEWVNNCCLMPTCAVYWSIFWREQFAFGWDDDHVHIVLDHRTYLAFYSTNSLKHDHVRIVLDHRTYLALYSTNSLKHDHVRIVLDHRTYLAFYSTKSLKH
jgi:hypothetical protein